MRLATLRTSDGTRAARRDGDSYVLLPHANVGDLLNSGADWARAGAAAGSERVSAAEAVFAPVVPHPNKIVCLGLNYATHIKEMGRDTPRHPTLFAKYDGSLIGADDPVT